MSDIFGEIIDLLEIEQIVQRLSNVEKEKMMYELENLEKVFPFNEYEYIISSLLGINKMNIEEYINMRNEYIARNVFLYVFEISAPRSFGEKWAQGQLNSLVPELKKPTKKIDGNYNGEYDFCLWVEDRLCKIEVKASRAVDADSDRPLYEKALFSDTDKSFWMNFQQVKPKCCDVFVRISVRRDTIKYRVLSSNEVKNNQYYSQGQHRGNEGEGQLHIKKTNINEFVEYEINPHHLLEAIVDAFKRQNGL